MAFYYANKDEIDQSIAEDKEKRKEIKRRYSTIDNELMRVTSTQEIAQEYPITADAVYQAIRSKRLAARQSGKTWLVLRRDAERLWGHKRKAG
jgi:hypothetical protein